MTETGQPEVSTITMHPGGPADENDIVWKSVLDNARAHPGKVITLILEAGQYEFSSFTGNLFNVYYPGLQVQVHYVKLTQKLAISFKSRGAQDFQFGPQRDRSKPEWFAGIEPAETHEKLDVPSTEQGTE